MKYNLPELSQHYGSIRALETPIMAGLIGSMSFLGIEIPRQSSVLVHSETVTQGGKKSSNRVTLEQEFHALVKRWKDETFFQSSLTKQFSHPAYIRIIAMGENGVPFVLREMQQSQDNWFYALRFMVGEDISAGIKDFEDAKAAWIEWGYRNNYI